MYNSLTTVKAKKPARLFDFYSAYLTKLNFNFHIFNVVPSGPFGLILPLRNFN
ncbi:protein of unknown function [Candidatus Nitrosocosmicus franklandus]|uniref:Uncharacterized protein n=1 Tax=Candidatus Nitrosocosmicus franklandianus TaxID=1798806 RepID=A0A484IDP4_9ARCH|nr:protein of unknown function [Candidatus Nitrosocosmicus franklandus]